MTVLFLPVLSHTGCRTITHANEPDNPGESDEYIIDDEEEFTFDDCDGDYHVGEDDDGEAGASFVVEVSSDSYELRQYRHFGVLGAETDPSRAERLKSYLARYNRRDLTRRARLLVSISPYNGRMRGYRLIRSTYVRELDSLIMGDVPSIRFTQLRAKGPSVLYITYIIHLYDRRHESREIH
ncbi:MAG: hypothetical protein ACOC2H_03155 [Spirochaetota bacterium]